jgi:hypothetical protein
MGKESRSGNYLRQRAFLTREDLVRKGHIGLREESGQRLGQREEVVIIVNKLRLVVRALLDRPRNSH